MASYELNLRDYWQIIQKRRWVFVFVFLLVLVPSIFYTNLQKPEYRTASSIQWTEKKALGGLLAELITVRSGNPLAAQAKIITSLPVLERVVDQLQMAGKDAPREEITSKAVSLRAKIETDIIADTNIIRIIVTDENPGVAAVLANNIADAYITESQVMKSAESRTVREFIQKQLDEVADRLKKSEIALAKFKESAVPSGVGIPLQNRLADLETQRQNLLRQFTENHPDVISIEEQVDSVKGQLKNLPGKELIYNRLTRDAEINGKIYRELNDKLEAARISEAEKTSDAVLVDPAVPPLRPVVPNKPLNYLLGAVIGLMIGLASVLLVEQLDTSIGTIEDVEQHLKLPALGVIPYLRIRQEKRKGIFRIFKKEPKAKDKIYQMRNQLLFYYPSSSPVFEAYRILRTRIQREVLKKDAAGGRVLLLTSSGPEEGKSITSSNLAIAMAQGGIKTLLIDADLRRSVLHKIFSLKSKEPGLGDILMGTAVPKKAIRTIVDIVMAGNGFEEIIKTPGMDNLHILTSGAMTANPAELLAGMEMTNLLNSFRKEYDLVIIDTPPVLAVTDASILASKADSSILVYRVGKTARSILARSKSQLSESGTKVAGIILNNISPEMEMRYGYYHHYKYYGKYYTQDKQEA
ncbi:MAG TPA: polysaccharide biosynthesis tyrosine autokinase [Candidatus Omnitrophota bacterium]|nr:polysaccharide biosynthesis tyrosine autokinase [Candidatus Omnitrophota bacterium]